MRNPWFIPFMVAAATTAMAGPGCGGTGSGEDPADGVDAEDVQLPDTPDSSEPADDLPVNEASTDLDVTFDLEAPVDLPLDPIQADEDQMSSDLPPESGPGENVSGTPETGVEGGPCYGNLTCNDGLFCDDNRTCMPLDSNPNEFVPQDCFGDECGSAGAAFGAPVGEYRGVVAYSNGSTTGCHACVDKDGTVAAGEQNLSCGCRCGCDAGPGSFGAVTPQTAYGIAFQCVEYVRRFYAEQVGNAGMGGSTGNAKDYASSSKLERMGLAWYPNQSKTPPQPDDGIVFTGGKYGHIAIVTGVGVDEVTILQQNTPQAVLGLQVSVSDTGAWTLSSPKGYSLSVAGWFRDPKHDWTKCPDGTCPDGYACQGGTCSLSGTCTPSWSCGGWSSCGCGDTQTRTCWDDNGCGTSSGKPAESQACDHCGNGGCDCGETWATCASDGCPPPEETCNSIDDDGDGVIDEIESCWKPVYRYWNTAMTASARARCWGNSASSPPAGCAGYTLEFPGPVFYLYATQQAGTASLIHFYKNNNHLLMRSWDGEINSLLSNGFTQGDTLGYIWTDTVTPPSGNFYQPVAAGSPSIRNLRRYLNSAAGIHLFANNPEETAPGWDFEGVKGYVWSSRW